MRKKRGAHAPSRNTAGPLHKPLFGGSRLRSTTRRSEHARARVPPKPVAWFPLRTHGSVDFSFKLSWLEPNAMPDTELPCIRGIPMLRRMKKLSVLPLIVSLALSALTVSAENTATQPVPRDAKWVERHEGFVAQAKQGGIDVLF